MTPAARAAQEAAEYGRGPAAGTERAPDGAARPARSQTQSPPDRSPGKGRKR